MSPSPSFATARGWHLAWLVLFASPLLLVALAALAALPFAPTWLSGLVHALTSCPHRALTGAPCPLCGSITASLCLLRGDIFGSLLANAAPLALLPLVCIQLGYRGLRLIRPALRWKEELALAATGTLLALAVLLLAA